MTDPTTRPPKLSTLLLGSNPKQQRYVLRSLLAIFGYSAGFVVVELALAFGLVEWHMVRLYEVIALIGSSLTFVAVRMGWANHTKDPALTIWQMGFASTLATMAYAMFDQIRGPLITIQLAVVVFGTFNLRRVALWVFTAYTTALMGVTMVVMHHFRPEQFPVHHEVLHFIILLALQPTIVVLGGQFSAMRSQLKRQRGDLENAILRIQELASRDVVTGLYNRRHAMELLGHELKSHVRAPRPCVLVLIDLDHFKLVNDTHGHAVGDEVLKAFSDQAQKILRESELIARWGGEEFLLVLPNAQIEGALLALGRLRAALAKTPVTSANPDLRVAFSAGITNLQVGESAAHAINRADEALYEAKAKGRGCDVVRHETVST